MDKLESMRVFTRVVDTGGFTAAADSLNLAKSAISQRVADLEAKLQVRLLNRTTRSISLTETGRVFYEHSVRILADLDEIESAIGDEQATLSGTIRITAPMSFGILHLGPAINDFLMEHPELKLDLDLNDRRVNLVEEGFDLAIRIGELEDSSLIARRLAPARRITVASPAYLEKYGIPQVPGDLVNHHGLSYTHAPRGVYWNYREKDKEPFSVDVPVRVRVNNGDSLRDSAIAGLGITILPTFIVYTSVERGELIPVLSKYRCRDLSLYAVYPPPRYQPQRVRAFVDFLAARFGDSPYWDSVFTWDTKTSVQP